MSGYFSGPTPRVFGHRGAAGLAPENTLPSFALALSLGADILELDVHASRDGVILVLHDATLERTTNGGGAVRDQPWAALRSLDAGHQFSRDGRDFPYRGQGVRIPTLESVLKLFPLARCNIEVKQQEPPIVGAVVEVVRRLGAEGRVLLTAEHDDIMQDIRRQGGSIATGFSATEVADFIRHLRTEPSGAYEPPGRALQIPARFGDVELVTRDSVLAAHRYGIEMHVWTVNQHEEMVRLLALGVDGIMSDLPGLARVVVDGIRS